MRTPSPVTPLLIAPAEVLPADRPAFLGHRLIRVLTATGKYATGFVVKVVLVTEMMFEIITGTELTRPAADLNTCLLTPIRAIGEYEICLATKFSFSVIIKSAMGIAIYTTIITRHRILKKVYNPLHLTPPASSIQQRAAGRLNTILFKTFAITDRLFEISPLVPALNSMIIYKIFIFPIGINVILNITFGFIIEFLSFGMLRPFLRNFITLSLIFYTNRMHDFIAGRITSRAVLAFPNLLGCTPHFLTKPLAFTQPLAPCIHADANAQYHVKNSYQSTGFELPPTPNIDLSTGESSLMALFEASFQDEETEKKEEVRKGLQNVLDYTSNNSTVPQTVRILVKHIAHELYQRQDNDLMRAHLQNLAAIGGHCYARYFAECRSIYCEICKKQPLALPELIEEILADYRERLVQGISQELGNGDAHIHNCIVQNLSKYGIKKAQNANLDTLFLKSNLGKYEEAFLRDYTPAHLIQEILKAMNQQEKSETGKILANYLQPDILWKEIFEKQTHHPGYVEGAISPHYADWLTENIYNPDHDPENQDALQCGTYTPTAATLLLKHSNILVPQGFISKCFQILLLCFLEAIEDFNLQVRPFEGFDTNLLRWR